MDEPRINAKRALFEGVEVPDGVGLDTTTSVKPCALCGSTDARQIYRQAHFPVVICDGCGLMFADEHFKTADLERFYSGDYYERAYVCHPPEIDEKIAGDYVDAFRRVHRRHPGGRLLDFGSARGTFLEALARTDVGPAWTMEGIDINADEVAMGQARGVPVRTGDVFESTLVDESYDAVTAFSVLEHMQDPRATLEVLRRATRPDGHLLLIVPNGRCLIILVGRILAKLLGERVRDFTDNVFHEEHLYYFDPMTMRKMLAQTGFEILEVGYQPSYLETHPPGFFVKLGAWGLRLASWVLRRQTMLVVLARRA